MKKAVCSLVAVALCSCSADPGYEPRYEPHVTSGAALPQTIASSEAPRKTVIALQVCADRYALRLSGKSNSYAVLYNLEVTGNDTTVKVHDSMVPGSELEACMTNVLESMVVPDSVSSTPHASPKSRSMVGIVQAAAAPIALLPIVLVAGGVTILVGVTIYVAVEVVEAARRRPVITKSRCLDAAAGGLYMWQELCRQITNSKKAERCWAMGPESEEEKRNWCNEAFGTW